MTSAKRRGTPVWDPEQLEVIRDAPDAWQLVSAGPGAGKSAVACQRIAHLVDQGVPPSRVLMVSFTRTAVAELRNRIVAYAVAGEQARAVRITTLDSHAWSLRTGFDEEELPAALRGSYEANIDRVIELLRDRNPDLLDFLEDHEHVIVDEAQDLVGLRAALVIELLRCLPSTCGVTILADPSQAIYGFTTDNGSHGWTGQRSLLEWLDDDPPQNLVHRTLETNHRTRDPKLLTLHRRARQEVRADKDVANYLTRVQEAIRATSHDNMGRIKFDKLPDLLREASDRELLVLFRRRAEVLVASSYCSSAGLEHRLRYSGLPTVVYPWIGWLFGETPQGIITREAFGSLWEERSSLRPEVFDGAEQEDAWLTLHRLAAGTRPDSLDLVQLRRMLARSRPPVDVCMPELGSKGPILGTIHASKGREADTVSLFMPDTGATPDDLGERELREEGRVYYVGATRARSELRVAASGSMRVGYLESGRIFRRTANRKRVAAQFEVGRLGDVDAPAPLAWTRNREVQNALASMAGRSVNATAVAQPDHDWSHRLFVDENEPHLGGMCIGQMSRNFDFEVRELWRIVDRAGDLRPAPEIRHLHAVAITTIALGDDDLDSVGAPYNASGFALAPVVKGFSLLPFFRRRGRS